MHIHEHNLVFHSVFRYGASTLSDSMKMVCDKEFIIKYLRSNVTEKVIPERIFNFWLTFMYMNLHIH